MQPLLLSSGHPPIHSTRHIAHPSIIPFTPPSVTHPSVIHQSFPSCIHPLRIHPLSITHSRHASIRYVSIRYPAVTHPSNQPSIQSFIWPLRHVISGVIFVIHSCRQPPTKPLAHPSIRTCLHPPASIRYSSIQAGITSFTQHRPLPSPPSLP